MTPSERPYQTGTRSRARSLVGGPPGASASHDNLPSWVAAHQAAHAATAADRELPPNSAARYRAAAAKRMEGGGRTTTTSAPSSTFGGEAHDYLMHHGSSSNVGGGAASASGIWSEDYAHK